MAGSANLLAFGAVTDGTESSRRYNVTALRNLNLSDQTPVRAIASTNGLEVKNLAYDQMCAGVDTLAAAVSGVTLVEDDPEDMTVGLGGLLNENGIVELDAAVMHGPTHQAGAVVALQRIRNAAQVAKLVMEQTDHVLLVGEGARVFASAQGFTEEDLLTETARKIWLYWKQTNSDRRRLAAVADGSARSGNPKIL